MDRLQIGIAVLSCCVSAQAQTALETWSALLGSTAFQNAARRYECVEHHGARIVETSLAGDDAFVELLVSATGYLPRTHVAREFAPHWRLQLHRANDGWRVVRAESVERDLATNIAFAEPKAQDAFLRDCDALVSPELVSQLVELGTVIGSKAQFAREERLARIALTLADDIRDPLSRARALWLLGRARDSQEAYDEALSYYDEARSLAETYGDRETVGRALVGRGWTHVNRYELSDAKEPLRRGLEIALSVDDFMNADNAYLAMAGINLFSGEYIDALRNYDQARDAAEKAGDRVVVAAATANAGLVFNHMNSFDLAADRLREAIGIYHEIGNIRGEMRNLRNLAEVEVSANHDEIGAQYLDRVEAWLVKQPNDRMSAFAAATRVTLAMRRHDYGVAAQQAERGLALARKIEETHLASVLTNALSEIRLAQNRVSEAAEWAAKTIELAEAIPESYPMAQLSAAKVYKKLGKTEEAVRALHAAIDSIESLFANVPGTEDEQQRFYMSKTGPYYEMFRLLVEQQQPDAAIEWVERSRSRSLIDYLGRNKVTVDRNILSSEERREESEREQEIVALNRKLRELYGQQKKDPKAIPTLEEEIRRKRLSLHDYKARLFARHPDLALARGALPRPSLSDVQKLIPADGAILQYVVDNDDTWMIVIRNTGHPFISNVKIDVHDLERSVKAFLKQIEQRDLAAPASSRAMYERFLKPVEAALKPVRSLCIIPDGGLWLMPFQALVDGKGRFFLEHHTIFYTPSLSLLAWDANHPRIGPAKSGVLIVANPRLNVRTIRIAQAVQRDENLAPLPEAEAEARRIEEMYGTDARVVVGAEATEAFLKRTVSRYGLVHLATHAMFDDTSPLHSHLVLAVGRESAEDGLLEAREIMNLDLTSDLVILSSCETGRGEVRAGEGLIGMSWALLMAGCPTAVVSQWKVGSASTATLMTELHRRLSRVAPANRRRIAASALRAACLAVMRIPQYRNPYDWSAFVVVGNGW